MKEINGVGIYSYFADTAVQTDSSIKKSTDAAGHEIQETGFNSIIGARPKFPKMPITFPLDDDRLFSTSVDYLAFNPCDTINNGFETAFLLENEFKWSSVSICNRKPRKMTCFGKPYAWIQVQHRFYRPDDSQELYIEHFPIRKDGSIMRFGIEGWNANIDLAEIQAQFILRLSLMEDFKRSNALRVSASHTNDGRGVKFALTNGAQSDFFKLRDEPRNTPTKRLNPIIHFVEKHARKSHGKEVGVSAHWRGVRDIKIDGMSLSISED